MAKSKNRKGHKQKVAARNKAKLAVKSQKMNTLVKYLKEQTKLKKEQDDGTGEST